MLHVIVSAFLTPVVKSGIRYFPYRALTTCIRLFSCKAFRGKAIITQRLTVKSLLIFFAIVTLYSKTALILNTNTAVQSQDEEIQRIFFRNSCCGRRYRWSDLCDLLWHKRDPIGRYDNPVLVESMSKWRDVRCHRESVHLRLPDWVFWK